MAHYAAEYTHVLLAAMVCSLAAFLLCWFWHLASNELRRHGVAKTVLFIALSIPLAIRSVEKGGGDRGDSFGFLRSLRLRRNRQFNDIDLEWCDDAMLGQRAQPVHDDFKWRRIPDA